MAISRRVLTDLVTVLSLIAFGIALLLAQRAGRTPAGPFGAPGSASVAATSAPRP